MSPYVCVDASVAAKWLLPEEDSDRALSLYEDCCQSGIIIAGPPHLPVEVTNAIRRRVARDLIIHAEGRQLLRIFAEFSIRLLIPLKLHEEAFEMAEAFNRPTVYDTHHIALAKILDCDLWTADEGLLNAVSPELPYVKWIRHYPR